MWAKMENLEYSKVNNKLNQRHNANNRCLKFSTPGFSDLLITTYTLVTKV